MGGNIIKHPAAHWFVQRMQEGGRWCSSQANKRGARSRDIAGQGLSHIEREQGYRFLGVKLLPRMHHLFLRIGRMFPGTLEQFLGMPKIRTNKFSFSYASRPSSLEITVFCKLSMKHGWCNALCKESKCTCTLVNARPPPEGTCNLPREPLLPPPPRFRDVLSKRAVSGWAQRQAEVM